jgi:alkanesulfonate monooxygenase SsuD/methylene tetrahydromethanopterin reductase-like flavin-dependent oxidoreductase (luciferase family)
MLTDQLAIIDGMWKTPIGETFSYSGSAYSVTDSPALPKPEQHNLPIIIGGKGLTRTPALAAQYATEFNLPFVSIEDFVAQTTRVQEACDAIGRDEPMLWSAALVVCCGADEAEATRRAAAIGRDLDELRTNGAAGTPAEVAATINAFRTAGAERMYLQVLDLDDLDHLDLIANEVAPLLD